jgi:hypothetical protein
MSNFPVNKSFIFPQFEDGKTPTGADFGTLIATFATLCGVNVFNPGANQVNSFINGVVLHSSSQTPTQGVTLTPIVTSSLSQTITGGEYLIISINNKRKLIPIFSLP